MVKFFKIKFDRIDATKDKKYMLEMSVQECPTGSIRVLFIHQVPMRMQHLSMLVKQ